MGIKLDYSDIKFAENGKLKLLITVSYTHLDVYKRQMYHILLQPETEIQFSA